MKKFIRKNLTKYFDEKGLFNQECIIDQLEEGNNIDVVYLDLARLLIRQTTGCYYMNYMTLVYEESWDSGYIVSSITGKNKSP